MSAFHDNALMGASGSQGYQISRSVRYRASASPYFTRPFATPTNSSKWTMSMWVKRGVLSSATTPALFGKTISASANFYLAFDPANTMTWTFSNTAYMTTTQVFRDPSAWYHIVAVWDSANATAAQRARLYVNGTEVTAFSVDNRSSITTSMDAWNTTSTAYLHGLGCASATVSTVTQFFDGYLTEINFIDGQTLTPSSFGENDTVTGVWKPKKYAGTYGTNGFYLNFSDNSNNTAATIGKDYSGNGNNWTPNNISVTSGVTYDSMLDVPTNWADGGNGRGNYCVLNPLDKGSGTISDGNLTFASLGNMVKASIGVSSGKWYWEINNPGSTTLLGISSITDPVGSYVGSGSGGYSYGASNGNKNNNATSVAYGATFGNTDTIGVAFDADAGTLTFYKNNTSQGTAFSSIPAGTYFPAVSYNTGGTTSGYANFGQRPFSYTPPTGFKALNTFNLPTPTIVNGATVMAATLWTGDQNARTISNAVNGVSFKPDLVWTKSRSDAESHRLSDSVRGGNGTVLYQLYSNLTNAEGTDTLVSGFASNGFTIAAGANSPNVTGRTYVGWQWQAGQGSTSSNTSGSITSTVSVNATAGFSVVAYNSGASGDKTVGHGLGVAPSMIITKSRSSASYNWSIYHSSVATTVKKYLTFTTDALQDNGTNIWGSAFPTSSVFGITSGNGVVASTDCIAYCFSAVAGYSAFGKYTGNNSSDGPFVFCGFRPRWILFKDTTNAATNWVLQDTSRFTYNVATGGLLANTSASEYSTGYDVDILSNGFKIRRSGGDTNASGATIVYAAFAENPYKLALAR